MSDLWFRVPPLPQINVKFGDSQLTELIRLENGEDVKVVWVGLPQSPQNILSNDTITQV